MAGDVIGDGYMLQASRTGLGKVLQELLNIKLGSLREAKDVHLEVGPHRTRIWPLPFIPLVFLKDVLFRFLVHEEHGWRFLNRSELMIANSVEIVSVRPSTESSISGNEWRIVGFGRYGYEARVWNCSAPDLLS